MSLINLAYLKFYTIAKTHFLKPLLIFSQQKTQTNLQTTFTKPLTLLAKSKQLSQNHFDYTQNLRSCF